MGFNIITLCIAIAAIITGLYREECKSALNKVPKLMLSVDQWMNTPSIKPKSIFRLFAISYGVIVIIVFVGLALVSYALIIQNNMPYWKFITPAYFFIAAGLFAYGIYFMSNKK